MVKTLYHRDRFIDIIKERGGRALLAAFIKEYYHKIVFAETVYSWLWYSTEPSQGNQNKAVTAPALAQSLDNALDLNGNYGCNITETITWEQVTALDIAVIDKWYEVFDADTPADNMDRNILYCWQYFAYFFMKYNIRYAVARRSEWLRKGKVDEADAAWERSGFRNVVYGDLAEADRIFTDSLYQYSDEDDDKDDDKDDEKKNDNQTAGNNNSDCNTTKTANSKHSATYPQTYGSQAKGNPVDSSTQSQARLSLSQHGHKRISSTAKANQGNKYNNYNKPITAPQLYGDEDIDLHNWEPVAGSIVAVTPLNYSKAVVGDQTPIGPTTGSDNTPADEQKDNENGPSGDQQNDDDVDPYFVCDKCTTIVHADNLRVASAKMICITCINSAEMKNQSTQTSFASETQPAVIDDTNWDEHGDWESDMDLVKDEEWK